MDEKKFIYDALINSTLRATFVQLKERRKQLIGFVSSNIL